ncbi:MAG: ADP-glyceromanno-heptose 6-epimerase [Elusimicrobia bacterium GWA2_56_46]|nr:MAG: ADP-glyceromanno-heptose 6-epimerase [Elusimicrobia bacterium GWA2_56_46]OGR53998.1 MAG: ADP-glyceromanno-heptose 6-epimerase [Elusimicrobia bacterium GWC2_56_31]HBB67170.1 ADP-glyceromanno-heptose 6-epimerase [Elusimicrobiota bacterium]HBW22107.1 ADP-glyceromanno-heptose 6-epimerase [Elusimicrobiota bacterium]
MRYLVTGGAGFIGSNLAFALCGERKAKVTVLDNFSSGNFKNLIGFEGEIISDDIQSDAWFRKAGPVDAVFHEAAVTDTTIHDQKKMMDVNVEGFRNVLRFALENGVKRVVYASSAGVYGNGECPMKEGQPPVPENVYGFSKAMMDNAAREFAAAHTDMTLVGLRYFNVYGPREYYKGSAASMIYQLYLQMKAGKRPRIFKFGEQMRDFVYVKDIVRANLSALDAEKSCVVNAATGTPENFNRVIDCLNKAMGTDLSPEYFDNPYGFFQLKTQADLRHAKAYLNYRPEWNLENGIADYIGELKKSGI